LDKESADWLDTPATLFLSMMGFDADAGARWFRILGSDAAAAVPELLRLLDAMKTPFQLDALARIGRPALGPLMGIATNRQY